MRARVLRARVPLLRERELVLRDAALRGAFAAPDAALPFVAVRDLVELPAVFPLVERGLDAVDRLADARDVDARVLLLAGAFARLLDALRPVLRDAPLLPELALELASPSMLHLPDITRCAASATASAMIEPSLVALETMLFAACEAVSAASSPASRILRRADGLALIAAAAAARPAASISLLIAALASLSTVESFELDEEPVDLFEDDLDELLRADLAMAPSPSVGGKTLQRRNGSRMTRVNPANADMLKGTAANAAMPFDMVSGRRCGRPSALKLYEHPSPTSVLNHETSDHLLSLR